MILRDFKIDDAPIILGWIKSKTDLRKWSADRYRDYPATPDEMAQLYAPDNMTPLTAEDENGNIIGHISIRIPDLTKPQAVRLGFIIVDDALRGKGYGKELIHQTIEFARKNLNATSISLGVFKNNPSALHCYESVGFKEIGQEAYSIDGEMWDGIEMKLLNNMCYFIIDTYIDNPEGRKPYDEYIKEVKPIVEKYGGEYLIRSEKVTSLHPQRTPQRVIIIRFPSREALNKCFSSEEYKAIMNKRISSVDARAIIVEE